MQGDKPTANLVKIVSSDTPTAMTRRLFVGKAATLAVLAGAQVGFDKQQATKTANPSSGKSSRVVDLLRLPDSVTAYAQLDDPILLTRSRNEWQGRGVVVESVVGLEEVAIGVNAPGVPLQFIHLRWREPVSESLAVLGDQWERSYGDLGWRNMVPE